jgi:hypothetical protein
MESYLRFVHKMELDKESLDLLMFKNAKNIFGL